MIYQLIDWLATYVECSVALAAVVQASGPKYDKRKGRILLFALAAIYALCVALLNAFSPFSFLTPIVAMLCLFGLSKILSTGNWMIRAAMSVFSVFVIQTIDYVIMLLTFALYGSGFKTAFAVFLAPGFLRSIYLFFDKLTDVVVYILLRKHLSRLAKLKTKWIAVLFGIGLSVYFIMQYLLSALLDENYLRLHHASVLSFLVLLCFFISVSMLLLSLSALEHEHAHQQMLQHANYVMEQNYQLLHTDLQENAKRIHDFHHHLRAISSMAKKSNDMNVQDYVHSLLAVSYKEVDLCHCGSDIIDAIINCSTMEAQMQQTDFTYTIFLSSPISISPVDICAVLGNQIENALEACQKIQDASKRFVQVEINQHEQFLIFRVSNPVLENPFTKDGRLLSGKQDTSFHGLGLKNIQSTAERYNGLVKNSVHDSVFVSEVLLCLSAN